MKRLATLAMLTVLVVAGRALAEAALNLDSLHNKTTISAEDRQLIRQWLGGLVPNLVTSTDPARRSMVGAREEILAEGRQDVGRSPAFQQAFGEEAIAALQDAAKKAISQDARLNIFMTVAELRRLEGVAMLQEALVRDPYAATRIWAAKGLDLVADAVAEKNQPRIEQQMAEAAEKALETAPADLEVLALFEMLSKFDHEKAHDVLAAGASQYVERAQASDPVSVQVMMQAITGLERAYSREVRAEAKARILSAYAIMAAWIMPPMADTNLLPSLNASLERITGDKVAFVPTDEPVVQKLAMMEWVEKLVRDKRIPKRPPLPPVIEEAVKASMSPEGAAATPAPAPGPVVPPLIPAPPASPSGGPAPVPAPEAVTGK